MGLTFGNPEVVFTFPGQEDTAVEEQARVTLRGVSLAKVREIQKLTTKKRVEYKAVRRGAQVQRFEYDEIDEDRLFEEVWDYAIVAWENISDAEGEPLACTKPSKLALINGSVIFLETLTDWREQLEKDFELHKETHAGN